MKLITGLVRPARLDAVKQALGEVNILAVTVVEARDYAPQCHGTTVWMGHLLELDSSIKMEVKVVVNDDDVDEVVGVVMRAARTGCDGDGHISIAAIDHRYSICSGRREV